MKLFARASQGGHNTGMIH